MDKISGIIPSSPRLQSVDLKDAAPVRPGTPSFGRPEGVSSLNKPPMISTAPETARRGAAIHEQRMDWRSEDARKANMAAEMSNSFFMKNDKKAEPVRDIEPVRLIPVDQMPAMSTPAGFKTDSVGSLKAAITPISSFDDGFDSEPQQLEQPEGLYPKGSFINRTA